MHVGARRSDNHTCEGMRTEIITEQNRQIKNKNFRVFEVRVDVNITEDYNQHDYLIQETIHNHFKLEKSRNDRWIILLVFHIDDIDNFTYFGCKSKKCQQLEAKKWLFNTLFASYNGSCMDDSKAKLLHAVNYPNYCTVTSSGVFHAMSDTLKKENNLTNGLHLEEPAHMKQNV